MLEAVLERNLLPDRVLRLGIRRLLRQRLREAGAGGLEASHDRVMRFLETLKASPVAINTVAANEQHYELPPAFFRQVLGRNLKYSSCLWPHGVETLDAAEEAMLDLTCKRAQLSDGMDILELGCGWGSLSLWMAERFPKARILAVSTSAPPLSPSSPLSATTTTPAAPSSALSAARGRPRCLSIA